MSTQKRATPTGRQDPFSIIIHGEPASKSNSRRIVYSSGSYRLIKSKKALLYLDAFRKQCPVLDPMFTDDVIFEARIYYASRRPDLDESLIMDALQGRIISNDRIIRKKIIEGYVDRESPRAEIRISRA